MTTRINSNNFWETDLAEVDRLFLPEGKKITDLPVKLDGRVPQQGSVLLGKTVNLDDYDIKVSLWDRIKFTFSCFK